MATKPTLSPSFADAFALFKAGVTPDIAKANRSFEDTTNQIADLRSVTPNTLKSIIGSGAPVTAALGFNDPTNLMGVLPGEYQAMFAPKESPSQILNRNVDLMDKVTGFPEQRRNLFDAARARNIADVSTAQQAGHAGMQSEQARNQQALTQYGLDLNDENTKTQLKQLKDHYGVTERIALGHLKLARDKAVHEENYFKAATAAAQQGATGFPADPKMLELHNKTAYIDSPSYFKKGPAGSTPTPDYGKITSDLGKLRPGEAVPPPLRSFVDNDMRRRAVGKPFGYRMPLESYSRAIGNWHVGILQPDGWYGVTIDGKGIITGQSPAPIISFGPMSSKQSGSSAIQSGPKYPGIPEE